MEHLARHTSWLFLILIWSSVECHKNQFRVLGLQYATLNQRFQLETKFLQDDLATAAADIEDLKEDNARIIQLFEVFTNEIRQLQNDISTDKLTIQSLERDVKYLHNQLENFKTKTGETLGRSRHICNSTFHSSPPERCLCEYTCKTNETKVFKVEEAEHEVADSAEGREDETGNRGVHVLVAKYGDSKAYVVNTGERKPVWSIGHLGSGVRAITVDSGNRRMYWSDDHRNVIMASDLDGNNLTVVERNVTTLGLGIDVEQQFLFYTNVSGDLYLNRMNYQTESGLLWARIGDKPRRIFIDTRGRFVYAIINEWTSIERRNYENRMGEVVVNVKGRIKAFVVDLETSILYFSVNSSIFAIDLKQIDKPASAIFHGTAMPSDLVITGRFMYIVYYYFNKIDIMDMLSMTLTQAIYIPWTGQGNTVSMCLFKVN
ncbi:uncharacterized protein [Haliotis cracherodii]|uniref:uncharacterized protein n=1 Tax=Haliotis cracherodii TaxID=6455 RepID=UPI0039E834D5